MDTATATSAESGTLAATSVEAETGTARRGRTTVSDRTVERIAARVLTEVEHIGGTVGRVLGISVPGQRPEDPARVTAKVSDDSADVALDVRLSVVYPESVAHATEDARAHLVRRVADLTGLTVTRVDITVTAPRPPDSSTRRVL
ncbi:Asp23/Gls24 family envelope stress response protein [Streptomyces sp. NPDC091376]|uniref:Asp23/Gls24 family envelope stress response protein n=1 Tax=Streptomyces sp. NPDC091376 TaxID=3365994 RepID=UPI0037FDC34D